MSRRRWFNIAIGAGALAWACSYWFVFVPWWTHRSHVTCANFVVGVVEKNWTLWTSSNCQWPSTSARWVLPAVLLLGWFYMALLGSMARDWSGGPPDWARDLSAFGFGFYTFLLVIAAGFLLYLWAGIRFDEDGDYTVLEVVTLLAVVVGTFFGALWAAFAVGGKSRARMGHTRVTGGPAAVVGSTLGVTAGVSVAMLALGVLLFAMLLYAAYLVFGFIAGAMVLGTASSMLR